MDELQFIKHEISVWGEDYIFGLIDSGFTPVQVVSSEGRFKWTWMKSTNATEADLTKAVGYATL